MTKTEAVYLAATIALAIAVGIALFWGLYSFVMHGVDPRAEFLQYIFVKHAWTSLPLMFALLGLAAWLDWQRYRRIGTLAAFTPFRVFALIAAVAILVWAKIDGI